MRSSLEWPEHRSLGSPYARTATPSSSVGSPSGRARGSPFTPNGREEPPPCGDDSRAEGEGSLTRRWLRGGAQLESNRHSWWVTSLAQFGPNHVLTSSYDRTCRVWDLATGSCQLVLSGHTSPALCVALLRCGSVVSGSLERVVRVWRAPSEAVEGDEEAPSACAPALLLRGHTDSVRCVGQLLDGRLYSGSDDGTLRLWGEQEGRPDATLKPGAAVLAVAQLPMTGQLLTGSADKLLRLWQLPPPSGAARAAPAVPASAALLCLCGHGGAINAIALLPPGAPDAPQRCVTGGADGLLCLWDLSAGQLLRTCAGHNGAVSACAVHPSGLVVSASMDRTVRLWGAQLGTCEGTLEGHTHWINALLLLPDGRILTAASDRTLRFWRDGACERVLPQPMGEEALAEAASMLSPAPAEACDYGQWSTPKPSEREEAPEDAGAACECTSQHSDATEQMQRSEEPPPAWWGTPPVAMAAAASTGAVALLVLALTLRRPAAPPVRSETQAARRRAGAR